MAQIDVRCLGPVAVERDGVDIPGPGTLARTLLALLVVAPRGRADVEALIDGLWGEALPRNPRGALHIQVSRLRRWLGSAGLDDALVSDRGGYRLAVRGRWVDLHRVHTADHDSEVALAAAIGEWRGRPFDGCVIGDRLEAERARLQEEQRRLRVRRAELLLDADRASEAVDVLGGLTDEHPADEALVAVLMRSLYRAGRQADALSAFVDLRRHLVETQGLDPGPDLVALQRRILAQDLGPPAPPCDPRPLAGREHELAELSGLVGGPGRVVLVEGESGVGKSALLRALAHHGRRGGARVGSGAWDEAGSPLTGWREALVPLGLTAVLGEGPLVHGGLADLATDGPVVLMLDDLHWADSASLGVLSALVRLGVPSGVLVVAGVRDPDSADRPAWDAALPEIIRSEQVSRLVLGPLPLAGVRELVDARLDLEEIDAERLAAALVEQGAGLPLHTLALLDLLGPEIDIERCLARIAEVPPQLRPLVSLQLAAMPRSCRRGVEALAVLGSLTPAELGAVVRRPALDLIEDLRPAMATMLDADADRLTFRHALVASAVRDGVPASARQELHHRRWAAVVADGEPFALLRHALGASTLLPPADIARARHRAGRAAHARGAAREALALLTEASAELGGHDRLDADVHRGLALVALGRRDEADLVLDAAVEEMLVGGGPGEDLLGLAVLAVTGDRRLGAGAAGDPGRLRRAHRLLAATLPRRERLDVLRVVVMEEVYVHGTVVTPGAKAEFDALVEGIAPDDPVALVARARTVQAVALTEAPVPAARRLAVAVAAHAAARRADDRHDELYAAELLMSASLAAGQVERARDVRATLERDGRRRHRPRSVWSAMLLESSLALAAGDVESADDLAERALGEGRTSSLPDAVSAYGVHLLVRHLLSATLPQLDALIADVATAHPHIAGWTAASAVCAVQDGRTAAARELLVRYRQRRAASPNRIVDRPGLCLAAVAAFALGDEETAGLVLDALPPDPDAVVVVGVGAAIFGPATLYTGLCEQVLGGDGRAAFVGAASAAGKLGWKPWESAALALHEWADGARGRAALPLGLAG